MTDLEQLVRKARSADDWAGIEMHSSHQLKELHPMGSPEWLRVLWVKLQAGFNVAILSRDRDMLHTARILAWDLLWNFHGQDHHGVTRGLVCQTVQCERLHEDWDAAQLLVPIHASDSDGHWKRAALDAGRRTLLPPTTEEEYVAYAHDAMVCVHAWLKYALEEGDRYTAAADWYAGRLSFGLRDDAVTRALGMVLDVDRAMYLDHPPWREKVEELVAHFERLMSGACWAVDHGSRRDERVEDVEDVGAGAGHDGPGAA